MRNRNLPIVILAFCAVAFAAGILELFKLRFEAGDVYPPYSTLRTDPLGASAYYEGLARLPGISVSRDFRATTQMPEGRGLAYLHLAGHPKEWEDLPESSFKEIENFVKTGGRLVIAFFPEPVGPRIPWTVRTNSQPASPGKPEEKDKIPSQTPTKTGKPSKPRRNLRDGEDRLLNSVSVAERWGIGFQVKDLTKGDDGVYEPAKVTNLHEPLLPDSLPWHSGLVMTNLDGAWRVIYARGADPVLAERRLGAGTVVFSTDSYFLSNEAMQKDRHAELLAWLVGPARRVMFDEAHLGILDDPGVAALLRKYRLHGLVAGLLLLAGLFIWKNSAGFGPVRDAEAAAEFVTGKDSASGFVNLLRRHIMPRDLLDTSVAEWRKSLAKGGFSSTRIQRVEAVLHAENALPPGQRNPVRTYQAICTVLKQGPEPPVSNPDSQPLPKKL